MFHGTTNIGFSRSTNGTNNAVVMQGAFTPTLNQWYHIAVDFDGTTYRIYIDGVVKASSTTTFTFHDSTAVCMIGDDAGDIGQDFDGWIDNVRITKGAARYAGAFTPPTAPFPVE